MIAQYATTHSKIGKNYFLNFKNLSEVKEVLYILRSAPEKWNKNQFMYLPESIYKVENWKKLCLAFAIIMTLLWLSHSTWRENEKSVWIWCQIWNLTS